ncbi:hypothetical protein BTT_59180 (plasmid) [Bacillus thuringiensis serovar morrisoni str. 4AA1]|nr:hypothetical protein BTT_59180 [Bacillus thuringiensis serovar morrisoni str. 4AA1]
MSISKDIIEKSREFNEVNIFPITGNKDEFCEFIIQAPFVYIIHLFLSFFRKL